MSLVVFTARFGETDVLRAPLVIDPCARYLCFSEQPCAVAPYEWVPMPSTDQPRLAARAIKILADHPALHSADLTLWHDASYQLTRDVDWVRHRLVAADLIALKHPSRTMIEQEAMVIARYGYLTQAQALAHVSRYRAAGFFHDVLTCSGLLARRASEGVRAFNRLWWDEVQQWSGRDQASLDYAAWCHQLRVRYVSGTVKNNRFARWREVGILHDEPAEAVPA